MKLALLFLLVAVVGCCSFARKWPKPDERTDLERWRRELKDHYLVPDEFANLVLARLDRQRIEHLTIGVDVGHGKSKTVKTVIAIYEDGSRELLSKEVDLGHH